MSEHVENKKIPKTLVHITKVTSMLYKTHTNFKGKIVESILGPKKNPKLSGKRAWQ